MYMYIKFYKCISFDICVHSMYLFQFISITLLHSTEYSTVLTFYHLIHCTLCCGIGFARIILFIDFLLIYKVYM